MTTLTTEHEHDTVDQSDVAVVVVSADSHVGPTFDQMRPYCPQKYLGAYDDFAAEIAAKRAARAASSKTLLNVNNNLKTAGHNDIDTRLREMDADGVAAEVIYHGSANGEVMPFSLGILGSPQGVTAEAFEQGAVGYQIYNRWLADFVSVENERHIGLPHLPTWDIDACVKELEWARGAGLRGVNFPPPGRPGQPEYNDVAWEPFWSACEDLQMTLSTHAAVGLPSTLPQPHPGTLEVAIWEGGGYMSRRALWYLIFGQVFERHPKLKLVLTEQYQGWWSTTLAKLDQMWNRYSGPFFLAPLSKLPSEYAMEHVYLGASFPSVELVQEATAEGYATNVLWGRDYPHPEGTYQYPESAVYPEDSDETLVNRTHLRYVFSQVPAREAVMMAGENGVRAYDLDGEALAKVADRIGALTVSELTTPPRGIPEVPFHCNAFRGPFFLP